MNIKQKKLLEIWIITITLVFLIISTYLDRYLSFALFVFGIYYTLNYKVIKQIESIAPNIKFIISNNNIWKFIFFVYYFLVLGISCYFLYNGNDFGDYINNSWKLMILLILPIIGPLISSQYLAYRLLGNKKTNK